MQEGTVLSVSLSGSHSMKKPTVEEIELIENFGVKGDVHAGATVKHVYDKKKNASAPNLRQVHIIHDELIQEMCGLNLIVKPGEMGENITCSGLDILSLPTDTLLHIGTAILQVRGLRKPCSQLDGVQKGLMKATIGKKSNGDVHFRTGIMCTVYKSGKIKKGAKISVELPSTPHKELEPV